MFLRLIQKWFTTHQCCSLCSIFKSLVLLELIFLFHMKQETNFIIMHVNIQFFPNNFLNYTVLFYCVCFPHLSQVSAGWWCRVLHLDFSIASYLFCRSDPSWPVICGLSQCAFLCLEHIFLLIPGEMLSIVLVKPTRWLKSTHCALRFVAYVFIIVISFWRTVPFITMKWPLSLLIFPWSLLCHIWT